MRALLTRRLVYLSAYSAQAFVSALLVTSYPKRPLELIELPILLIGTLPPMTICCVPRELSGGTTICCGRLKRVELLVSRTKAAGHIRIW